MPHGKGHVFPPVDGGGGGGGGAVASEIGFSERFIEEPVNVLRRTGKRVRITRSSNFNAQDTKFKLVASSRGLHKLNYVLKWKSGGKEGKVPGCEITDTSSERGFHKTDWITPSEMGLPDGAENVHFSLFARGRGVIDTFILYRGKR